MWVYGRVARWAKGGIRDLKHAALIRLYSETVECQIWFVGSVMNPKCGGQSWGRRCFANRPRSYRVSFDTRLNDVEELWPMPGTGGVAGWGSRGKDRELLTEARKGREAEDNWEAWRCVANRSIAGAEIGLANSRD